MIFIKISKAIKEKRFIVSLTNYLRPYLFGIFIFFFSNPFSKKKIFISCLENSIQENINDNKLVLRIMKSYKKMTEDFSNSKTIFKPSKMWINHVNKDFKYLKDAAKKNDIKQFKFFLQNFGNWNNYLGLEHNLLIKRLNSNFFSRKYLEVQIFDRLFKLWKIYNNDKNLTNLNQPRFGNQVGAYIENNFVTIGSFFNQIISDNLLKLMKQNKRVIISELGAGYGKLAFYILKRLKKFCYIDYDLPEVLVLASYFLIKSFPNKKAMLYGEDNFSSNSLKKYDLIFLPSFEIEKIKDNSIDLFLNKNSLGEMRKEQVKYFCKKISTSSNYFFHMNHNRTRVIFSKQNKSSGLLANEYPLKEMKLIFKYFDLGHLFQDGFLNYHNDIIMHIYKNSNFK